MTTTTAETPATQTEYVPEKRGFWAGVFYRWPVKLVIFIVVIIWIIPTLGVLISSFRPPASVDANGWWTVFSNLGSNEWTLSNYSDVLSSEGFGNS
ncbi:MAG: hypothetical protein WBN71_09200, partial [Acidimicrobiia bacterium]